MEDTDTADALHGGKTALETNKAVHHLNKAV